MLVGAMSTEDTMLDGGTTGRFGTCTPNRTTSTAAVAAMTTPNAVASGA
jgi:hypothetical protein